MWRVQATEVKIFDGLPLGAIAIHALGVHHLPPSLRHGGRLRRGARVRVAAPRAVDASAPGDTVELTASVDIEATVVFAGVRDLEVTSAAGRSSP